MERERNLNELERLKKLLKAEITEYFLDDTGTVPSSHYQVVHDILHIIDDRFKKEML